MRCANVRRMAFVVLLLLGLLSLLAACTGPVLDDPSDGPSGVAGTTGTTGTAAWESTVNFAGSGSAARPVHVMVHPLVRLQSGVLLTVDLSLQDHGVSTREFAPFCIAETCQDLGGISLIDTDTVTRFGPLRSGRGGPMMTSSVRGFSMRSGTTYRLGAVFADPGTDAVAVDLQQAGVALNVPITSSFPAANVISTQPPPAGDWDPDPVTIGSVTTAPVPAVTGSFTMNEHDLMTRIVGGPVNGTPGMVTLGSDRLFAAGSSTLVSGASAPIAKAASIVAAQADPSQPVMVTAYTDPSGSTALTRKQAKAVARQLSDRLKQFRLVQRGAGSSDPVAVNSLADGKASAPGRALNRRIELAFTPQDTSDEDTAATPMTPSSTPSVTPGSSNTQVGPAMIEPGTDARFTAQVESVTVDGALTLVRLRMRSDQNANPIGAFSTRGGKRTDVGAFHLLDRTSDRVYVPAADLGDPGRVTGIYTHRFSGETSYEYTFFTSALPPTLTTVDVALAGVGTVRGVPITR